MKYVILFLLSLGFSAFTFAQSNTSVPLKDSKLSPELIEKLKSTPVAKIVADENDPEKKTTKLFQKKLNTTMPDGSAILSAKVFLTKKDKIPFLARTYKVNDQHKTMYLPLTQKGNKLFIDFKSSFDPAVCLMMLCTTCDAVASHTGMITCECKGGETGDCSKIDVSYPNHVILERVFK